MSSTYQAAGEGGGSTEDHGRARNVAAVTSRAERHGAGGTSPAFQELSPGSVGPASWWGFLRIDNLLVLTPRPYALPYAPAPSPRSAKPAAARPCQVARRGRTSGCGARCDAPYKQAHFCSTN